MEPAKAAVKEEDRPHVLMDLHFLTQTKSQTYEPPH
jgi:hypothetical protein